MNLKKLLKKKIREYHMDDHEKITSFPLTKSVQSLQLRSTIIVGQDKSVFKQYSFSQQQCWFGPNGETKLLLKKGYSQMILVFGSRSFGVGLKLTNEELSTANEQRRSEK